MAKVTRYTLTAAIGDAVPGDSIELTDAQAESPLYASRITVGGSGRSIGEAEDEAARIIADAEAKATEIVQAAQAEAMKLATAKK